MRAFLERLLALQRLDLPADPAAPSPAHIEELEKEIATVEARIASLIRLQADAPPAVVSLYTAQIAAAADQLDALRAEVSRLAAASESPIRAQTRALAYDDLARAGLNALFAGPDRAINQLLHRLLAGYTFRVEAGVITGLERTP